MVIPLDQLIMFYESLKFTILREEMSVVSTSLGPAAPQNLRFYYKKWVNFHTKERIDKIPVQKGNDVPRKNLLDFITAKIYKKMQDLGDS